MSFLGNSPGTASQRIPDTFNVSTTTSVFTPSSGYTLGYLDVFLNGVKLVNGDDFTASNGTTFTLTSAALAGDVVECIAYIPRGLSDGYTKSEADAKYSTKANNLSDLASAPTARNNLGLGSLATVTPTGTPSGSKFLRDDNTWQTVSVTPTAVSSQANSATDYFALPAGTTAQRPASPVNGMIRYNTTLASNEIYQAGSWQQFSFTYYADYLVVAGGGGNAAGQGGNREAGSGAGGLLQGFNKSLTAGSQYTVTVGAGGSGHSNGSNSSFLDANCIGGGTGGNYDGSGGIGASGGSGGGGWYTQAGGSGTSGQGNAGGTSGGTNSWIGGGGGGAGSAGSVGSGGSGVSSSLSGSSVTYAAGGAGNTYSGAVVNSSGSSNSGNGASGIGNGGSGIVIIRYAGSQRASGGTVTSSGGYTIHTFTSSGVFTA